MFLTRRVYDDLKDDLSKLRAESSALTQVNAQLNAHIEWMRVRLTQVEMERAQLLKRYMNVDVPTPTFEEDHQSVDPNQTLDFQDVGDKLAKELGLEWTNDGYVVRNK